MTFTREQAEVIMAAFDAAFKAGVCGDGVFQNLAMTDETGDALYEAEKQFVVAILKDYPEFEQRYPAYIAAMKTGW